MQKKPRSTLLKKKSISKVVCPIEVMAKRGIKTMLYGPMKPVGLEYPDDYKGHVMGSLRHLTQSFSCAKTMRLLAFYNIVGFQTHLKWGEQKRVSK